MDASLQDAPRTKSCGRNFPSFVNNSMLGFSNPSRFRSDFLNLEVNALNSKKLFVAQFPDAQEYEDIEDSAYEVSFVSPYDDSFACSWVTGEFPDRSLIVGIFHKNPKKDDVWSEPSDLEYPIYSQQIDLMEVHRNSDLMDICHMDNMNNYTDLFMTISQYVYTTCSRIQMRPKDITLDVPQGEHRNSIRMMLHKAWSAAWNSNIQKLSLGTCTGIFFTTLDSLFGEINEIFCPGGNIDRFELPYVQRFNSSGSLLYFGLKDGHVASLDTRAARVGFQSDILIGEGVTDFRFLQDENTMIVGGTNDKLCCVDMRMNSVLFDYPGHYSEGKKTAFHVNESFEILCSSGRDYVTRYWDLKYGNLFAEIPEKFPEKSGLFMYTALQSSGHKLSSYSFCGDRILHREAFPVN